MPLPSPMPLTNSHRGWRRPSLFALAGVLLLAVGFPGGKVEGASSGATGHFTPASGGSGRGIGDFVSSSDNGSLGTYYSFFVEVPSGLQRLVVELFDADANNSGAESGGRDRERTNNNSASNFSYRIFGPDGVERTGFLANGTATTPTGSDNAWLALYDTGDRDRVRDEFSSNAYTNNNGNVNWLNNWTETNDDNVATTGLIFVTGGRLNIRDNGGADSTIQRSANLSGWSQALLSLDFQTTNDVDGTDAIRLEASPDGTTWTLIDTFTGPFTTLQSRSYDLKTFITIGANTRIRFIESNGYTGAETFFADNVQIQDAVATLQNGHWEVRIDGSDSSPGDDINAIGIRAHDGTSGSGGTELNVYYDSFTNYGVNDATADRVYSHHPYVTAGCSLEINDFDGDGAGSYSVTSRSGTFTGNSTGISGNNVWRNQAFTSWRTDNNATDYGIWTLNFSASADPPVPANSGNYYTVYLTNSLAADSSVTAPSSQPTPNSFRVYLKTDAGAAPAKPYLEQQLRYGSGPGPNPPVAGQTTRMVVTVRFVNPTSTAITFTGANVIANVPGSGVVYAGGATVSQGTVTAPAVGGTGNVSWNPGTVAAGATVLLAYQVNVTPSSAGQRLVVAPTPGSGNGTRATFVDETGNTSQTRSTMTLGPLCDLAATADVLTPVVVSGLSAETSPAGTTVSWTTASEVGGAGFNVYRLENGRYRKLNERLLPALSAAPQGGSYRFLDRSAPSRGSLTYRIEEVDHRGQVRQHGPFTTTAKPADSADLALDETGYRREARAATPALGEDVEPATTAASKVLAADRIKLGIDSPGVYLVTPEEIATKLEMKLKRVVQLILTQGLELTDRNGAAVPWLGTEAGLVFYGQGIESPYSRDNAYWLRVGPGLAMAGTTRPPVATPLAGSTFESTVHAEADLLAATVVATDPESDYWYWSALVAADPTDGSKSFAVEAPAAAPLGTGRLRLGLKGASASGVAGEHHAVVRVNGVVVGETQWEGTAAHAVELDLGAGIVQPGSNTVAVEALLGSGVPFSFFYVDDLDLTYTRRHRAAGDTLSFQGGGAPTVAVEGFTRPDVVLFDVSKPGLPRAVQGVVVEGDQTTGYRTVFSPAPSARYVAASPAAFKAPRSLEPVAPSSPAGKGAEYLVLTTAPLKAAAQELANLRAAQGMSTEVVDVADIMNEWNGGVSSPAAIRAFLAWRYANTTPAPRFVVLAGAGSFDYRDNLGLGGNLVPPLMASTGNGLFAADNLYGDLLGNDGVMEVAVGRIPARTAGELSAYVAKVAAYESEPAGTWSGRALFLSDDPEGGVSFPVDSQRLTSSLPRGVAGEPISLGDTSLAAARAALFSALGQGVGYVSYVGHGGLDRMAAEGLLTSADVPGLPATSRVPVVSALTCIVNRFEVPGFSPLGVELLRKPAGGAVAVFAPTGLSYNAAVQDLGDLFFLSLQRTEAERLGEAALSALTTYFQRGSQPGLASIYTLLGDPALRLADVPVPATVPSGPGD